MQHPYRHPTLRVISTFIDLTTDSSSLGKVVRVGRIKPHAPPLVRAPVNSFEFQPCGRTPQAAHLMRLRRHEGGRYPSRLMCIVYG